MIEPTAQTSRTLEALGRARISGGAIDLGQAAPPASEDDGYHLQWRLHEWFEARGWGRPVGWKVGATTAVMQRLLKCDHPSAGGILHSRVLADGSSIPFATLCRPGIEAEIAVRLATAVPAAGTPYDQESIRPFVLSVMPAMELVDDRYGDFKAWPPAGLIADDFFQSACVLGPESESWHGLDLAALGGVTRIDGKDAGTGLGAEVMGHPLAALAWLANRLAPLGRELRAGEFVLLGSLVAVQWLEAPAQAQIEIERLGKVSLILT